MLKYLNVIFMIVLGATAVMANKDGVEERAKAMIQKIQEKIQPVATQANIAWWEAENTGSDEAYARRAELDNELNALLSDRMQFSELKAIKKEVEDSTTPIDPLVVRQIEKLYLQYLGKQIDPALLKEITDLSAKIEKSFNNYRGQIDGRELTENELKEILKKSNKTDEVKQAWLASKGVAAPIEADLKELVAKRNRMAVLLGFKNFHDMSLRLDEHNPEQLNQIFEELDQLTRQRFAEIKADIDTVLAQQFSITTEELRPWHYRDPFFQNPPDIFPVSLDTLYTDADQILRISKDFYNGIGLSVDAVLERSDLFPRAGKSQHAFCTDIDRAGDTRVLANIVADEDWMSTMLHELGHAIYSSVYFPKELPYFLRDASHTLTTEGLAMMIDRQTKVAAWMEAVGVAPENPETRAQVFASAEKLLRYRLLIFSRWAQVMYHFEREMYGNPNQDLNKVWWDLVEKFQMVKRPEGRDAPDYASKIHIIVAPVYYHNYALGDLFASQLHHAIAKNGGYSPYGLSYANRKDVGAFIKAKVVDPGARYSWNDLTKFATGENLNAQAFAKDMAAGVRK